MKTSLLVVNAVIVLVVLGVVFACRTKSNPAPAVFTEKGFSGTTVGGSTTKPLNPPKVTTPVAGESGSAMTTIKAESVFKPGIEMGKFSKRPTVFTAADLHCFEDKYCTLSFGISESTFDDIGWISLFKPSKYLPVRFVIRTDPALSNTVSSRKTGKMTTITVSFSTKEAVENWRTQFVNNGLGAYLYPKLTPEQLRRDDDVELRVTH